MAAGLLQDMIFDQGSGAVVGVGAGGHAKVVVEILRAMGGYEVIGLLDARRESWGTQILGVPVLGDDALLAEIYERGVRHAFIGLGTVKNSAPRVALYEKVRAMGFEIVRALHPQALISPSAQIGDGPTVMAGAVINADAHIGDDVIVNTGAIVEHDCTLGHHVHVATGARLAGAVSVGAGSHIGIGASVRQGVKIGSRSVVGAGAVVVHDVPDDVTVMGVPARIKGGSES
jgi:UDP-perosamine 4-acetyltransferase